MRYLLTVVVLVVLSLLCSPTLGEEGKKFCVRFYGESGPGSPIGEVFSEFLAERFPEGICAGLNTGFFLCARVESMGQEPICVSMNDVSWKDFLVIKMVYLEKLPFDYELSGKEGFIDARDIDAIFKKVKLPEGSFKYTYVGRQWDYMSLAERIDDQMEPPLPDDDVLTEEGDTTFWHYWYVEFTQPERLQTGWYAIEVTFDFDAMEASLPDLTEENFLKLERDGEYEFIILGMLTDDEKVIEYVSIGASFWGAGNAEKAKEMFQKALSINSKSIYALLALTYLKCHESRFDEVVQEFLGIREMLQRGEDWSLTRKERADLIQSVSYHLAQSYLVLKEYDLAEQWALTSMEDLKHPAFKANPGGPEPDSTSLRRSFLESLLIRIEKCRKGEEP